ncbi:bifunctional 5,10-methylenetetrahydrofolate dehydrogenase/5,10-methenyltetrahydrofolate cyclohydrolase [Niallia sp. XMNu-256]|uniref:bifunctional 5,10-methylenetetrahydrofolate dehydrogenase/5,10-methenyltetrahydrofolate cyclohydrolase n=1 Tax=Niallia sp. XMNu-256 TaxID=3082444 RepID=UPI0030CD92E3
MGERLAGKPVVESLRENILSRVEKLNGNGVTPTLQLIRVGAREDDLSYERSILKNCERLNIKTNVLELPVTVTMDELKEVFEKGNSDKDVHGIMIFRPLPDHLDPEVVRNLIDPAKDIDCMSPINLEKVFEGNSTGFAPCTPKAVIEVLKHYDIPLNGANIAVAGRSLVVGKPLSMLLLDENATVTICHSRTKDMPAVTSKADIVVAAIGKAKFMGKEYFSADQVVIDVGINDDGNGKICGDVDYDEVIDHVKALTPPTGGVGLITTTILLEHVVKACENSI